MKKVITVLPIILFVLTACEKTTILPTLNPPENFTAQGDQTGLKVQLSWTAPSTGDTPDGYIVYFNDNPIDTVSGTQYTHDPQGQFGTYKVTAYKGETESDPTPEISTEPIVSTAQVTVHELAQSGNSGLGFTSSWTLTDYPMADPSAPDNVDFYFTDALPGSGGDVFIASAHMVVDPWEEGRPSSVPTSGWRHNMISEGGVSNGVVSTNLLTYDFANPNSTYGFMVERDGNQYYGLLETGNVTSTDLTIVRAKVQPIPGLRLIGQ